MKSLLKLAKKLRKEILAYKWEFKGDFETYKPSTILSTSLKWVLLGPHRADSPHRKSSFKGVRRYKGHCKLMPST